MHVYTFLQQLLKVAFAFLCDIAFSIICFVSIVICNLIVGVCKILDGMMSKLLKVMSTYGNETRIYRNNIYYIAGLINASKFTP